MKKPKKQPTKDERFLQVIDEFKESEKKSGDYFKLMYEFHLATRPDAEVGS